LDGKKRIFYIFLIRNLATATLLVTIDSWVLRVFGINNKMFCFPVRLLEVYGRNANALWAMAFPIFFIYYNIDNSIFEEESNNRKFMRRLCQWFWIFPIVPACAFVIFMVNFYNPAMIMDTYYPIGTHIGVKCDFPATNQTSCIYGNEERVNKMKIAESIYMGLPCMFSFLTFIGLFYAIYMVFFSVRWLDSNKYNLSSPKNALTNNAIVSHDNPILQKEKARKNLKSSLILVMGYPFLSALVVTLQLFIFLTPRVQNSAGYMITCTALQTSQGIIEFLYFFCTHYHVIKGKVNIPNINLIPWSKKWKSQERETSLSLMDIHDGNMHL